MNRKVSTLIAAGAMLALVVPAHAAIYTLTANLDSSQETNNNGSPATGFATGTLDDLTGQILMTLSYTGLTSNATAAHIHGLAGPGVNAAVILPFTVSGGTTGTGTLNGVLSALNVQGLLSGLTYVNVHDAQFPGGEIRGQVSATASVPGPVAFLPFAGGLVAALRRRRRKAS